MFSQLYIEIEAVCPKYGDFFAFVVQSQHVIMCFREDFVVYNIMI